MDDPGYDVRVLTLSGGGCPVAQWYGEIREVIVRARILARIERLRTGNLGDAKSVGQGVHEIRLDIGPGYRIYFAIVGNTMIVLIAAGDKGTQQRDITRAQRLWKEHKNDAERYERGFPG